MTTPFDVVAVIGSLRRESLTRRLVGALTAMAPASLRIEVAEIAQLTLYNQDLEDMPPIAWRSFRERIRRADAVLFATPEYNRSIPGVLKNAIDVASRPYGANAWAGKPAAIVSMSPGAMGAFGANHHLRQALVFLDMPTLQQPELYIGGAEKLLDGSDNVTNPSTRQFFTQFLQAFEAWIGRLRHSAH
ncbi:MAG: NADPH-dependent FMN reductase [Steroidobacteraceae bacterium]